MRKFSIIFVLGILGLVVAEEVDAQTAPTTSSSRRIYPGGRDDSDLTVQTARKITRKGDDVEIDYHGPASDEPTEGGSAPATTPVAPSTDTQSQ